MPPLSGPPERFAKLDQALVFLWYSRDLTIGRIDRARRISDLCPPKYDIAAARRLRRDRLTTTKRPRGRPPHVVPSKIYQHRRSEIIEAAAQIFAKNGYDETSLDDVAQAINLSKPTLYYYFPSKAHLFYTLAAARADEAIAKLAEIGRIEDARARLIALIRFQLEQVGSDRRFYRYFFDHRPPLNNKKLKQELREKLVQYSQFFYDGVERAIEAGILPPIDRFIATQAIFGATFWIYKWYDPEKLSTDDLLDQFLTLIHVRPEKD